MSRADNHAAEWAELERIDFLLGELARAVETGELHPATYESMAPRYLARRAVLVAEITGEPLQPPAPAVVEQPAEVFEPAPTAMAPTATPQQPPTPEIDEFPVAPVRQAKPVEWTTVLLFLGAFLVIVASAIFSVAVWDVLSVGGKLGFLGTLTAGFYAAGWWARTRLHLKAGSTALTVVASAMLLLVGWIAIDGYNLEGPLPWAALLLVCNVVYWFTEVRLADRFYGVVGAAAQVGWWWLLGMGLDLPVPVRLAGIAVIAVLWQLAAERGRGSEAFGSLARVLEWAAPVTVTGASLGLLGDLTLIGTAGVEEAAATVATAASTGVVLSRTRLLPSPLGSWAAAAVQGLVLLVGWMANATSGPEWWVAGLFFGAAAAYTALELRPSGVPMAIAASAAELALVLQVCAIVEAEWWATAAAVVVLAAVWQVAAELLGNRERFAAPVRVHRWAAPLVGGLATLGLMSVLLAEGSVAYPEVVAAAIAAVGAGYIMRRSPIVGAPADSWLTALVQVPLLLSLWLASSYGGAQWWIAAVFLAAAAAYDWLAIRGDGVPMAIIGLAAELSVALQVCDVLDVADATTLVVVAGLAALWSASGRLALRLGSDPSWPGAAQTAAVAEAASFLVLAVCSLLVPIVVEAVPLTGTALTSSEALTSLGVLVAWAASAVVSRRGAAVLATAVYSLYAAASLVAWLLPEQDAGVYGVVLLGVAAAWIAGSRFVRVALDQAVWADLIAGLMRVAIALIALVSVAVELFAADGTPTYLASIVMLAAAAIWALDAWLDEFQPSAAAAPVAFVLGAGLGGIALATPAAVWDDAWAWGAAIGAGGAGLLAASIGWVLRGRAGLSARLVAVSAGVAVSLFAPLGAASHLPALAVALALPCATWLVASAVVGQWLVLPSGLAALGAVAALLAHLELSPLVTVVAFGGVGLAAMSAVVLPQFASGGRFEVAGWMLSLLGALSLSILLLLGGPGGASGAEWYSVGATGLAAGLALAGAGLVIQGWRRDIEPGYYLGFGCIVAAIFVEMGELDVAWVELYSTVLALYLASMGYLAVRLRPERTHPVLLDWGAAVVGLGYPLIISLGSFPPDEAFWHAMWVVGLSLAGIGLGVVLKVRAYFFGGVAALVAVAVYRSFSTLIQFWWLWLGLIGVAMLVVALTWERQRMLVGTTRDLLRRSFHDWR